MYSNIFLEVFNNINLFVMFVFIAKVKGLPSTLKIGAIFSEAQKQTVAELAFKYAVYTINRDKGLLPETNLLYDIQYTNELDSFHTSKKVCTQISNGVQTIFGPSNSLISSHVHSICDALDLPHLEVHVDSDNIFGSREEFAINLHPYRDYINDAFLDAINYLNWTRVGILHEKFYAIRGVITLVNKSIFCKLNTSKVETYVAKLDKSGTIYFKTLNFSAFQVIKS